MSFDKQNTGFFDFWPHDAFTRLHTILSLKPILKYLYCDTSIIFSFHKHEIRYWQCMLPQEKAFFFNNIDLTINKAQE